MHSVSIYLQSYFGPLDIQYDSPFSCFLLSAYSLGDMQQFFFSKNKGLVLQKTMLMRQMGMNKKK